ncbi:isochorismatase family protein [Marinactinospora thermotolerans]|uniref:Bifunctional isochorismate lyase / aryl carrier protein n=1 Tax=Marinactinospora thermotolerans DSM 45154 TaxID=1122192 RepID=A0A1T4TG62_9ACTN|nr:isochorismatase family protein [Marinactinospora thermotolerans]SKA39446.1 bifunctional isochorismate lyase / aryl carrier protein [Marinactinospora thermotolerans DSM 45154]
MTSRSLPRIEPYDLPGPEELPPNRAAWSPDPERAALLVHDMQGYFLRPFAAGTSPLAPALDNIALLRAACHAAGVPVFYTAKPGDMDPDERGLERDFWGAGMRAIPEHTEITARVAPADGDVLLTKWRYSAFARTGLADLLREQGRDQLLITGVYAHIGCLVTATDAFMRDIQPFLVADAVADFSAADHRFALDYAAQCCAAVLPTQAVTTALSSTPAATVASHA